MPAKQPAPQKPNKLWYGYAYTKGFFKACFQYPNKETAKEGGKHSAISLGTLYVGHMIAAPLIGAAAGPFLSLVVSLGASVVGIHYGIKAFQEFRHVAQSPNVHGEVYRAENKWRENKAKGGMFSRLGAALKQAVTPKKKEPDTRPRTQGPISEGVVFEGRDRTHDFNDTASAAGPKNPPPPANTNTPPASPRKKNNGPNR